MFYVKQNAAVVLGVNVNSTEPEIKKVFDDKIKEIKSKYNQ